MLYSTSKRYLLEKLKEVGFQSPYTTQKALLKSYDSHVGAVLFESETYARNGSKKQFRDEEGARHKRRKVFDRMITFKVLIGDYTDDAVETMLEAFIKSLDTGIYDEGNFVPLEVNGVEWLDIDDSILKAKVAAQIKIDFNGGIYKDSGFTPLTAVKILSAEMDNGKEPANGN